MKTFKLIILFFAISVAAFSTATVIAIKSDGNLFGDNSKWSEDIYEEETLEMDGVSTIDISGISADIKFYKNDNESLKAVIEGKIVGFGTKENHEFTTTKNDTTIEINEDSNRTKFNFGFGYINSDLTMKIYVPESYTGNVNIDTVSGDVLLTEENLNQLVIKSVSGDVQMNNVTVSNFKFKTTSGDMSLNQFQSSSITFQSVSGDFDGSGVQGDLTMTTTSGDLDLDYDSTEFQISIASISGDVDLNLKDEAEFDVDIDTISGDIDVDFSILVTGSQSEHRLRGRIGESANEIVVATTSGNVHIF